MKRHLNVATNVGRLNRSQEETCVIVLAIAPIPDKAEELAPPGRVEEVRSSNFGTGPSWEYVDNARWYPVANEEMADLMAVAPIDSLTEEQYRRFSKVVLPRSHFFQGFSREEMPPLDWIKRTFTRHLAVAQFWRRKKSNGEMSFVRS
jgi:hypothetical protein